MTPTERVWAVVGQWSTDLFGLIAGRDGAAGVKAVIINEFYEAEPGTGAYRLWRELGPDVVADQVDWDEIASRFQG